MTYEELKRSLYLLDWIASVNQTYFKRLAFWLAAIDRGVRIFVGILAVLGLIAAVANDTGAWPLTVAVISVVAALVLNILPLHTYETTMRDFHRRWSDLLRNLQMLEVDTFGQLVDVKLLVETKGAFTDDVTKSHRQRFKELKEVEQLLQKEEFFEWRPLIRLAEGDERERRLGKGVRTREQEQAEMNRLLDAHRDSQELQPAEPEMATAR